MNVEATVRLTIVSAALDNGITDLAKIEELVKYVMEPNKEEEREPAQLTLI